jgi:hypothetical protein
MDADYKAALIEEYEAYVRAGRDDEAEHVAAVLKSDYSHEVSKKRTAKRASAPERADRKAPEAAVPERAQARAEAAEGSGEA